MNFNPLISFSRPTSPNFQRPISPIPPQTTNNETSTIQDDYCSGLSGSFPASEATRIIQQSKFYFILYIKYYHNIYITFYII